MRREELNAENPNESRVIGKKIRHMPA